MSSRHPFSIITCSILAALSITAAADTGSKSGAASDLSSRKENGFVLDRPLLDFFDTAFVLTDGGKQKPRLVDIEELADHLVRYDVIFFGEIHRHPGVHLQQQKLLRALHARFPGFILSLEQFERDVQPTLNNYLDGKAGEITLVENGRAWDNYRTSYRPLVQFAKDNRLPVIAAEAPVWSVVCVGQWGPEILNQFTPEERGHVARELHIAEGPYREKYMKFQAGTATHGGGGTVSTQARIKSERSFAGQVTRDDTMAESIFLALQQYPGRKVLHLNGSFHSAGSWARWSVCNCGTRS